MINYNDVILFFYYLIPSSVIFNRVLIPTSSTRSVFFLIQVIIAIIFFLLIIRKPLHKIKLNVINFDILLILFFIIWTIFTAIIGLDYVNSIPRLKQILFSVGYSLFIITLFFSYDVNFKKKYYSLLVYAGVLASLTVITDYFNITSFYNLSQKKEKIYLSGRSFGILGEPNFAVGILGFFLVFIIYNLIEKFSIKNIIFLGINVIAIFFTGSRMGLVISITIIVLLFFKFKRKLFRKDIIFKIIMIMMIMVILFFLLINNNNQMFVLERYDRLFNAVSDGDINADLSFKNRLDLLKRGIKIFFDNIFFGIGYGNFIKLNDGRYAHNTYIEIATGVGLLGFIIYLYFIFIILILYYFILY